MNSCTLRIQAWLNLQFNARLHTVKVTFEAAVDLEGHSLVECVCIKSNKVSN